MKKWTAFIPAICWILLILYVCTLPGNKIPDTSFFKKIHMDKIVHFCLFGGTVFFLSLGVYRQHHRISAFTLLLFVIVSATYGLAIEYIQEYWAINRSFDMYDFVADTLGAIAGVWVFKLFRRFFLLKAADHK